MAVFLMSPTVTQTKWTLASFALQDAYTDFVLSRQAMQCTPATLEFYRHTAGKFLLWLENQGVTTPQELTARLIRQYLAELTERGAKDTTLHAHARAIRTLVIFWHGENYIPAVIKFEMPKLLKKRLPVLTAEQLQTVIKACNIRDRAIVLFMADSGLRRAETIAVNWGDVDMGSGLVTVKRGKGGKARSAVIGASTRRALLQYRRTIKNVSDNAPLFQTREGGRFVSDGFIQIFNRLKKHTGIHVTPHCLRRTFVILSLRADMSPLHLQALLGHSSLTMTMRYAALVDDDLLSAHGKSSPIDNLSRLK
jgi:site-specific recombinase XerD